MGKTAKVTVKYCNVRVADENRDKVLQAMRGVIVGPALVVTAPGEEYWFNPNTLRLEPSELRDLPAIVAEFGWDFELSIDDSMTQFDAVNIDWGRTLVLFDTIKQWVVPPFSYIEMWDSQGEGYRIVVRPSDGPAP